MATNGSRGWCDTCHGFKELTKLGVCTACGMVPYEKRPGDHENKTIARLRARVAELEQQLETSRADLSSLKAVALAQNSEWQAMADEWDRFWAAMGVCSVDITVDQAIEKWQAMEASLVDLTAQLKTTNKEATDTWNGWADGLRRIEVLEHQVEHLRRENDRLRAAAGNCGGEPMVERRAKTHEEKEASDA